MSLLSEAASTLDYTYERRQAAVESLTEYLVRPLADSVPDDV